MFFPSKPILRHSPHILLLLALSSFPNYHVFPLVAHDFKFSRESQNKNTSYGWFWTIFGPFWANCEFKKRFTLNYVALIFPSNEIPPFEYLMSSFPFWSLAPFRGTPMLETIQIYPGESEIEREVGKIKSESMCNLFGRLIRSLYNLNWGP